ncbi:aspartate-semialdehyde dehydrogenase [Myxococcaceae bacterium]|jgi:aspartate-semialdehyde dehydrogenase|nr:aspartate-semialdehyde dehydrogenase [Myxococcaceae bacterium]
MKGGRPLRVAVAGATGTLGRELLAVLEARRFPVGDLVALGSERSQGESIEFREDVFEVTSDAERLRGCDLVWLCSPPGASLEILRLALRLGVPCIDASGALAGRDEIPLVVADLSPPADALAGPVIASPASAALAIAPVLAPLAAQVGIERVVATALASVSGGGRLGIEALSAETIALFNQQELPEPIRFGRPVAFDVLPSVGDVEEDGATAVESWLARDLRRLFGADLGVAVTAVRVPTFAGDGAALCIETGGTLDPRQARTLLAKAPGVELWDHDAEGPNTRASAGRDVVLVGRIRRDPSSERGLLLWLAADTLHLAALNSVRLAEARVAASG